MTKIYFFILFSIIFSFSASAQRVIFTYDNAGNQIERKWLCVNCSARGIADANAGSTNSEFAQQVESLSKDRSFKAYPNPVNEVLNVDWKINEKDVFLGQIDVYTVAGVKVFNKKLSAEERTIQISFSSLAPGSYLLYLEYSDKKREIVKIVKM